MLVVHPYHKWHSPNTDSTAYNEKFRLVDAEDARRPGELPFPYSFHNFVNLTNERIESVKFRHHSLTSVRYIV